MTTPTQRRASAAAWGVSARGEDDEGPLVEQVEVGPEGGVAGEGVEEAAHPGLLRPDDGHGRVLAVAEFGVGVDEGAAPSPGSHPGLQRVEDQEHCSFATSAGDLRIDPGIAEAGQQVFAPAVGAPQQVERNQGVLGAEPVVEGLLRRPRGLRDQVDTDSAYPAQVEQVAGRVQQTRSRSCHRRQRPQDRAQLCGGGVVERGEPLQHGHVLLDVGELRVYQPVWLHALMATTAPARDDHTAPVRAVALVFVWSSGFIGAELGADAAPPATALTWRFLVTAVVLLPWLPRALGRLDRREWIRQAVLALLCQCLYLAGVFWAAAAGVPAGTSALDRLSAACSGARRSRAAGRPTTSGALTSAACSWAPSASR